MPTSSAREKNPNWQGGRRVDSHGYIQINVGVDHPMAAKGNRYVGEHRLVMAEKIGRWLTPDEIVHHIDEDKRNNDPDNLEIEDRATHMRRHYANKPRPSAAKQLRQDGKWVAERRPPRPPRKKGPKLIPLADRLWPKIDSAHGDDECHPFTGYLNSEGYGMISIGGRRGKHRAHRVVYELVYGPIEDPTLVVRHTCDNPPCCNPKHLILGTRRDNNRDRGERKRGREQRQFGEANANVKIRDADLPRIRELRAGGWTQMAIAAEFGVKQPQISRILRGNQRKEKR